MQIRSLTSPAVREPMLPLKIPPKIMLTDGNLKTQPEASAEDLIPCSL